MTVIIVEASSPPFLYGAQTINGGGQQISGRNMQGSWGGRTLRERREWKTFYVVDSRMEHGPI